MEPTYFTDLSLTQRLLVDTLLAICATGFIVSVVAFFAALAWEYSRYLKRTAYQRAVERYLSGQETLRTAEYLRLSWGYVPARRA